MCLTLVLVPQHLYHLSLIQLVCLVLSTDVEKCALVPLLSVTASAEHIPEVTTSNHIITETTCISTGMNLSYIGVSAD
jgi:hypothetical protein